MPRPKGVVLDGAFIRSEREARGWPRERLAQQTLETVGRPGLTRRTIGNAEAGKAVSHDTARIIALTLQVPLIFLIRHDFDRTEERLENAGFRAPLPPEEWVGRRAAAERVLAALLCNHARVCIRGPVGSGRSALAQLVLTRDELSNRYMHGVLWLSIRPPLTMEQLVPLMLQIASVFDFQQFLPTPGSVSVNVFAARFRHFLGKGRVLLVLDEIRDDKLLTQLLPDVERVGVLVVAGGEAVRGSWQQEVISDLTPQEVTRLVHQLVSDHGRLDSAALSELAELTGGMPGCARALANLLQQVPELTLERVLQRYRAQLMELELQEQTEPHRRTSRRQAATELLRYAAHSKLIEPFHMLSVLGHHSFTRHWVNALFSVYATLLSDTLMLAPNVPSETHWSRVDLLKQPSWLQAQSPGQILAQSGLLEAYRLTELSPSQRWAEFNSCRALWKHCWEQLLRDPSTAARQERAARARAVREDPHMPQPVELPELIELALAMRSLLIQGTVPEARDWLYAAYLSARSHRDAVAEGQLAEMIGRHCYPDYAEAFKWFEAGVRALEPTGQCASLASVLTELGKMHHGMSRWHEGLTALQRAYDLSLEAKVQPALAAVRANNLALGHLVVPDAGGAALAQSSSLLQNAMLRMTGAPGMLRMVHEVARMNLLLSHWRQQVPLPAGTRAELDAFIDVAGVHSLYLSYPVLSARWLGIPLKYAGNDLDCEQLWRRALLGKRQDLDPVLRHVSCVVSNLRRLLQLQQHNGPKAESGTLAIIDATASLPELADTTGSMALCYIVEPFQRLFSPAFIEQLLRVVERGYGHYHTAFRSAAALYVEHRGGAPLSADQEQQLHLLLDGCVEDASPHVVAYADDMLA